MRDTKFTPGPHTLDSVFADIDGYKIVKEGRVPRLLAVVKNQDSAPVYEAQANAHLYAAAPEMYEALRGIESTYVFLDSLTAGIEPQHTNTVKALAFIRAALAKADGSVAPES